MTAVRTLVFLPILLAATTSDTPADPVERVNVCHITHVAGSSLHGTVMSIPVQAWPAHQRHLDFGAAVLNVGDPCGMTVEN